MSDAIYTLANDKTLDWLFGLVGSLQNAGCELSINVIPFNKQTTKLRKSIKRWHGVQLWEPPELNQLDEIGWKICETEHYPRNVFRKLATFWCPHDTFIYLDADIVVGGNPSHWIARYKQARAEVDIVAMDDAWWWVFRPGRISEEFERCKRAAVNTGFWIGRRGLISFEDVVCAGFRICQLGVGNAKCSSGRRSGICGMETVQFEKRNPTFNYPLPPLGGSQSWPGNG